MSGRGVPAARRSSISLAFLTTSFARPALRDLVADLGRNLVERRDAARLDRGDVESIGPNGPWTGPTSPGCGGAEDGLGRRLAAGRPLVTRAEREVGHRDVLLGGDLGEARLPERMRPAAASARVHVVEDDLLDLARRLDACSGPGAPGTRRGPPRPSACSAWPAGEVGVQVEPRAALGLDELLRVRLEIGAAASRRRACRDRAPCRASAGRGRPCGFRRDSAAIASASPGGAATGGEAASARSWWPSCSRIAAS